MSSKFKSILDAHRDMEPEETPPAAPVETQRPARPKGKRSDPDFEQVSVYIRKETHRAAKIALLQDGAGREFSELAEELLAEWLRSRV